MKPDLASNRSRASRQRQAAFTLIEMLTVMAIIAILAGILLPVLSGARGMTRRAQCGANLRQVGLGIRQYALDNRNYVPYATTPADWSNSSFTLLNTYMDSPKSFLCPSDPRQGAKTAADFTAFTTSTNVCSYSLARRMSCLANFKDFIIAIDRVGTGTGTGSDFITPGPLTFSLLSGNNSGVKGATWIDGNHGTKGGNVLFGDGRVSFATALPCDMVNATDNQTSERGVRPSWESYTPTWQITAQNPK